MIGFFIGAVLGTCLGFALCAIVSANGDEDE